MKLKGRIYVVLAILSLLAVLPGLIFLLKQIADGMFLPALYNMLDISTTKRKVLPDWSQRSNLNTSYNSSDGVNHELTAEQLLIDRYIGVNKSVIGKEFHMDNERRALVRKFLRNETFKRKPITIDPSTPFFELVVPVCGASSNHFKEFMGNIGFFPKEFPGIKLLFYDLGLDDAQASQIKSLPYVIFRKFNFSKYPEHVKNLLNYAWKLLIVQEVLSEFDGVMWFDTSITFQRNPLSGVLARMVHFKSGSLFFLKLISDHSAAAATNPGMIEYFPVRRACLEATMLPGATIMVFNTADVQMHVMKWATLCALIADCISPPGSRNSCPGNIYTIPRIQYAGCHRYEQALLTLLLSNLYNNERYRYTLNSTEAFAFVHYIHN